MNDQREAPAFLEYPGDHLSSYHFRQMPIDTKGVWITLRYLFWLEDYLPSESETLCQIAGIDKNALESAWPYIFPKYFDYVPGDTSMVYCPALADYKETYKLDKKRKSEGGKKGYAMKILAQKAPTENNKTTLDNRPDDDFG
jgi:hypothetical protein